MCLDQQHISRKYPNGKYRPLALLSQCPRSQEKSLLTISMLPEITPQKQASITQRLIIKLHAPVQINFQTR